MVQILDETTIGDFRVMTVDGDPILSPPPGDVQTGCLAFWKNKGITSIFFNDNGTSTGWKLLAS